MRQAIISDIHANQEALIAVLEDIEDRGIDDIICLGDIVGYGPEPVECITLVQERCRIVLMGNHDYALLKGPEGFNFVAASAIECHKMMLDEGCLGRNRCASHLRYLEERPETYAQEGALYVHASPRDHLVEYILPSDVAYGPSGKITGVFEMIEGVCFVGHSHIPGVVTTDQKWLMPDEANGMDVSKGKFIVNDGSVGQPRDNDPRACYVEFVDGTVLYHRVEYDVAKTMKKITDGGCLHPICSKRLEKGK